MQIVDHGILGLVLLWRGLTKWWNAVTNSVQVGLVIHYDCSQWLSFAVCQMVFFIPQLVVAGTAFCFASHWILMILTRVWMRSFLTGYFEGWFCCFLFVLYLKLTSQESSGNQVRFLLNPTGQSQPHLRAFLDSYKSYANNWMLRRLTVFLRRTWHLQALPLLESKPVNIKEKSVWGTSCFVLLLKHILFP